MSEKNAVSNHKINDSVPTKLSFVAKLFLVYIETQIHPSIGCKFI